MRSYREYEQVTEVGSGEEATSDQNWVFSAKIVLRHSLNAPVEQVSRHSRGRQRRLSHIGTKYLGAGHLSLLLFVEVPYAQGPDALKLRLVL